VIDQIVALRKRHYQLS